MAASSGPDSGQARFSVTRGAYDGFGVSSGLSSLWRPSAQPAAHDSLPLGGLSSTVPKERMTAVPSHQVNRCPTQLHRWPSEAHSNGRQRCRLHVLLSPAALESGRPSPACCNATHFVLQPASHMEQHNIMYLCRPSGSGHQSVRSSNGVPWRRKDMRKWLCGPRSSSTTSDRCSTINPAGVLVRLQFVLLPV
jgi:hypothetical protein